MQTDIRIIARFREGRRTKEGYRIYFIVTTSDGAEFRSHRNYAEAEQLALEHCQLES